MKTRSSWKTWVGGLGLLAIAGAVGWTQRSGAPATRNGWTATDRNSGVALEGAVWSLVATREGGFGEGIAQGVMGEAPPAALLAQARRLAVGAYGYETREVELASLDGMGGRVELEPVREVATLSLASEDERITQGKVTLMIFVLDPKAPSSADPLWWLHRNVVVTRTPIEVPFGRGHTVQAVTSDGSESHVRWPYPARLTARRPTVLHVERTRRIELEVATGPHDDASVHAGWLHLDPRALGGLEEGRRSGLAMLAGGGGYEADASMAGLAFAHVPRVPLTGVVRTAAGWFTVELDASRETIPVPPDGSPLRRLTAISVDGEPLPEGAVVLPGTLSDDLVNAILARGWLESGGLGLRSPKPEAWQETRLPTADTLTVWHRDRGLARLQWGESGVAAGAWEPGFVHLRRHPACRHRAALSVRSGCVGSPLVSSGTSRRDGMERPLAATPDALAGGIPYGPVAIELRTWSPEATRPVVVQRRLELDAASPCARFSMAEDGRLTFDGTGPVPVDGR